MVICQVYVSEVDVVIGIVWLVYDQVFLQYVCIDCYVSCGIVDCVCQQEGYIYVIFFGQLVGNCSFFVGFLCLNMEFTLLYQCYYFVFFVFF